MNDPIPNVIAGRFCVLSSTIACFRCGQTTPVAALVVPEHRTGTELGEESEDLVFEQSLDPALLGNITWINEEALSAVHASAPWLDWVASATAGQIYLGNACAHCGELQGDWFLRKPDAPFFPMTEAAADALGVAWHSVELQAVADCGYSSWIDQLLERRGDYVVPCRARRATGARARRS